MRILFFLLIVTQISLYGLITQANLYCQKITAYYNGTFQEPTTRSNTFDAQLQVTAEINLADKCLYFKVDGFNKSYSESYEFGIWNDTIPAHCNTNQTQACSTPFDDGLSVFDVYFYPFGNTKYWPWLFRINPLLNKRFTLLNPVGNCATTLKYDYLDDVDPLLYKNCFCCGDKYNPDPSLGCPASPWS